MQALYTPFPASDRRAIFENMRQRKGEKHDQTAITSQRLASTSYFQQCTQVPTAISSGSASRAWGLGLVRLIPLSGNIMDTVSAALSIAFRSQSELSMDCQS